MNITSARPANPEFHAGDEVVLADGAYQGTPGVFLRLREDANWADIAQRDGIVRMHPVAWLAYAAGAKLSQIPTANGD